MESWGGGAGIAHDINLAPAGAGEASDDSEFQPNGFQVDLSRVTMPSNVVTKGMSKILTR